MFNSYPKASVDRDGSSLTNYYERRGHIPALASLSIYRFGTGIIGEAGSTERGQITLGIAGIFHHSRTGPALGRAFTEAETTYETDHVAILTDVYWRQRFHADPNVIGRQIRVDGALKTVVGVLPPGFRFLSSQATAVLAVFFAPGRSRSLAEAFRRKRRSKLLPGLNRAPRSRRRSRKSMRRTTRWNGTIPRPK